MTRLLVILLIGISSCSAVPPPAPPEPLPFERDSRPDEAPLVALTQQLVEAYQWKSIETFTVVTDENFSPSRSRFLERIENRFSTHSFSKVGLLIDSVDFDASGKLAIVRGQWTLLSSPRAGGADETRTGSVELVFAGRNGSWKLIRQDGAQLFGAP